MRKSKTSFHKIVLADDDVDDRDLFSEALELIDPSLDVTMMRDGEELIQYLRTDPRPDMIFLDLNMPKRNGKECLAEMLNLPELQSVPVIIYTTSLNPKDIEDTFSLNATRFMRKPSSFEELKTMLHRILFQQTHVPQERTRQGYVLDSGRYIPIE